MTRFLDGPAQGQCLMLKRAARFLRVVRNAKGKWDALDQKDDVPAPDEELFAYQIAGKPGGMFIRPGGFYVMAEYRLYQTQPADIVMRGTSSWQRWCAEEGRDML